MSQQKSITFYACGPGVVPKYQGVKYSQDFKQWFIMKTWCESQGWKSCEDYIANSDFKRPWFFNSVEKQVLFTLMWV